VGPQNDSLCGVLKNGKPMTAKKKRRLHANAINETLPHVLSFTLLRSPAYEPVSAFQFIS